MLDKSHAALAGTAFGMLMSQTACRLWVYRIMCVTVCVCALTLLSVYIVWSSCGVAPNGGLLFLQRDALMYNAAAEIGTGFLLIVMLATQRRAILLTFLHWNWLRMRYFSPDAASYHSMVGIVLCPYYKYDCAMLCYALHAENT